MVSGEEREALLPISLLTAMAIIVYNRKNETHADSPNNFRIYRPFVLGNPYSWLPDRETKAIYKVANRDEALKAYDHYFDIM